MPPRTKKTVAVEPVTEVAAMAVTEVAVTEVAVTEVAA